MATTEQNKSEEKFRRVLELAPDGIVVIGSDRKIQMANAQTEKMFGFTKDEMIGKGLEMLMPDRFRHSYPEHESKFIEDQKPRAMGVGKEIFGKRKDGSEFAIEISLVPLQLGDEKEGKIVLATIRDITEQKKTERKITASQAYTRSLIEASLDPLVTISPEGKITDVNEASVKVTGETREKLIGTDFSNYFTEPEKAREGYKQVFDKGFVSDYPLTIHHKNGKLTDVLYNASVYTDDKGNVLGVFAAARDVTEQKQASQYARSLIEASLDPLVTISPEGKITDVNEASVKVTGETREKLIGTDFSNYFTEPEKARAGYKQVFDKGFVSDYPLTIHHKNGKLTDVLYNASVYTDDKGNVLGVFAAARDVTNKKAEELIIANKELVFQNEEKEKRAAELVIANKELVFQNEEKEKRAAELIIANKELVFQNEEKEKRAAELVIANKELVFQNEEKEKRAAELVIANKELVFQDQEKGKRADELIIANKELVFQNEEKEKRADELILANKELVFQNEEKEKRAAELVIADKELVFQNKEKEKRAAELVIADKELVFQNKEKEKRAAELMIADKELVFQNEEKEKRKIENIALEALSTSLKEAKVVAELATLNAEEAKGIAENALQSKQQFLSNMSHEIRTPMTSIIGFTQVLLNTDLSTNQKEYLQIINTSGNTLLALINDILDLAKVNTGKMTFEQTPFKMEASITTMLQVFDLKIQENNLELVKEYDKKIPKVLVGDASRLHQILLNLLSNAIKFTAKGKITMAVRLLNEDKEKATIEFAITDTGTGIPEDKLELIFESFEQASRSTSRKYGGTGLGLSICKQLVEKQGGSILVKSKVDEGSTFSFTLSFQKTNIESKIESEEVVSDNEIQDIKVLLVEDIKLNQLLMKIILEDFKFKYDIADNGKIAIEKLQTETYDIILMDLQMPEMNGFEATEYIRNTMKSKIPIIALTADVTTVDLEKCKAIGMNDYVSKPLDEGILHAKIIELLKHKTYDKWFGGQNSST